MTEYKSGEYVAIWTDGEAREIAKVVAGEWFEDCGTKGDRRVWHPRPTAPAWIGSRIDLPEGN